MSREKAIQAAEDLLTKLRNTAPEAPDQHQAARDSFAAQQASDAVIAAIKANPEQELQVHAAVQGFFAACGGGVEYLDELSAYALGELTEHLETTFPAEAPKGLLGLVLDEIGVAEDLPETPEGEELAEEILNRMPNVELVMLLEMAMDRLAGNRQCSSRADSCDACDGCCGE